MHPLMAGEGAGLGGSLVVALSCDMQLRVALPGVLFARLQSSMLVRRGHDETGKRSPSTKLWGEKAKSWPKPDRPL